MGASDLQQPEYYINRELSWLEFNRRVLEQAKDNSLPLLERLRFLCIFSTNLDEFFEIRVAGLKQQAAMGSVQAGPDNLSAPDLLKRISEIAHKLVAEQYKILNETIIPDLTEEDIRFLRRAHWNPKQAVWIRRYFNSELLPVLSPLGLDPSHPFPRLLNKSLNFIVSLEGKDAFGRDSGIAVVQAPRSLPRVIHLPQEFSKGPYDFVFLSSIIHAHVDDLFPGMKVTGCYQFRLTRNSELFVDEEEVDDLLRALEGELSARQWGDMVRLEVSDQCPEEMTRFLLGQFALTPDDLYQVTGPVNLNRLLQVNEMVDRPDLKYPSFTPGLPRRLARNIDFFDTIRRGDILLHHPFESFAPVLDFLRQAAHDPNVLAIKQTLYRTGHESAMFDALVDAARAGKEVTVIIELRARFEEEANIRLATRLHEAGVHVVYGVVGYKIHAKMLLVVRKEGRRLRRYCHLSTGNYHARTTRVYTDYGLLTCDKAIGDDVHKLFQQLTGLGRIIKLKNILQSPFTLHKTMLELIEREAEFARSGKEGRIIAKMNSLEEPQIIQALYKASRAGVKIELIVRGVCCLRPGVAGVSDNIQVRSIVGRFLEHSRIFFFHNNGENRLYCSSADWMHRNFFSRVEICFSIDDARLRKRILNESLLNYLSDNAQSWLMGSDGIYRRARPGSHGMHRRARPAGGRRTRSAQRTLLELLGDQTTNIPKDMDSKKEINGNNVTPFKRIIAQ